MKKLLSFALVLTMLFALAIPAMAANGNGDLTAQVTEKDGEYLLTVKYESGNNSIKAGYFEVLSADGKTVLFATEKPVAFNNKQGAATFTFNTDIPANAVLRMTEDKSNKPVEVTGVFKEGFHIHNYSTIIISPNCTEKGYTTYLCRCGDSYDADYVNELGHSYSKIIIPMTPESDGYTMNLCSRKGCGDSFESDRVDCKPYDWQIVETIAPTCTEQGYTIYKDYYWNKEKTDNYVTELGHDYKSVVTEPTCIKGGFTTHTCQREGCDDSYVDNEKDALGHDWKVAGVIEPTCEGIGYTTYKCSRCEGEYNDHEVNALGHLMAETWTVIDAATCEEDGLEKLSCTRGGCEYFEERTIEATGHVWDNDGNGVYTNPTREADGYTTYTCTVDGCGKVKTVINEGSRWVVTGATATITNVSGQQYRITVIETYSGGSNEEYTHIFRNNDIPNNGSATFDVGPYKVTIKKSGNNPGIGDITQASAPRSGEATNDEFILEVIDIVRVG